MGNANPKTKKTARERILETAEDLFYRQGYRATGINEIIAKADVAKQTFYDHFPSKDDLCETYLQDRGEREIKAIKDFVDNYNKPLDRFTAVVRSAEPWMVEGGMKGCAFLNMVAENTNPKSKIRQKGMEHYQELHEMLDALATNLINSDKKKYGHLNAKKLAKDYFMIFIGGVALAEVFHEVWPLKDSVKSVERLLE